jgi:hypothetical protein
MSGNHSVHGLAQPKTIIRTGLLAVAAIAAALALTALVADSASAQQPAICDQYPQLPQCDDNSGGGGGGGGGDTDPFDEGSGSSSGDETTSAFPAPGIPGAGGGPTAGPGGGTGGELPFTGYPLTPLLLILLLLLLAGLLIRAYLAARERWQLRRQGASSATAY